MQSQLILRPFQIEALQRLKDSHHLLCLAPPGAGKSLIFQQALQTGLAERALILSPLTALSRQHQERLSSAGIAGQRFQILSPESLLQPTPESARERLKKFNPDLLVVDECHLIFEWGDSFRPAFREILKLPEILSLRRSLWLTATLPWNMRLQLRAVLPFALAEQGGFEFPDNIALRVLRLHRSERVDFIQSWISDHPEPGLVFALTRGQSERLGRFLKNIQPRCCTYHAGLSREERQALEREIRHENLDPVIATSAFGQGMDYSQMEWVILTQAPPNLLSLVQAVGRVGRSGREARAFVLWDEDDFRLMEWMNQDLKKVQQFLNNPGCRVSGLKEFFDHVAGPPCGRCDGCRRT